MSGLRGVEELVCVAERSHNSSASFSLDDEADFQMDGAQLYKEMPICSWLVIVRPLTPFLTHHSNFCCLVAQQCLALLRKCSSDA